MGKLSELAMMYGDLDYWELEEEYVADNISMPEKLELQRNTEEYKLMQIDLEEQAMPHDDKDTVLNDLMDKITDVVDLTDIESELIRMYTKFALTDTKHNGVLEGIRKLGEALRDDV